MYSIARGKSISSPARILNSVMETPPSPYMHGQSVFDQVTPLSNEEVDLLFSDADEFNDCAIEADDLDLVTEDHCSITLTPVFEPVTKITYIMLPPSAPLDAVSRLCYVYGYAPGLMLPR